MDIQVEKGQFLEISITDIGSEGEGIGRYNGCAIFVDSSIPGDKIKCKVIEVKKNYAKASLIEIIEPSQDRIIPLCPDFDQCGGCQLQNMNYEAQLKIKKSIVENTLCRIGGLKEIEVKPIIGMDDNFRYRNKVTYLVQNTETQTNIGFYKKHTHQLIDIKDCMIQDEKISKIVEVLKNYMKDFDVNAYNKKTDQGSIRHLMVRKSDITNEVMVIIVTKGRKLTMTKTLATKLIEADSRIVSIIQNINTSKITNGLGDETKVLFGKETIEDNIDDLVFQISPESFYQVNSIQTRHLYKKVMDYAQLQGLETVLDIYCGIGTISLLLAKKAKKVYGIENVEGAVINAKKNAEINKIENTEFLLGQAEEVVNKLYEDGVKASLVVLDPPRSGCEKTVISAILKMEPKRIIYLSCKPATLSRDLKEIIESGKYSVLEVQPVDMFPHTGHVECVIKLQRKN